jgi:hypothetical protein
MRTWVGKNFGERGAAAGLMLLAFVLIAAVLFGWHLYASGDIRRHAVEVNSPGGVDTGRVTVVLNPLTNVVIVTHHVSAQPPHKEPDNPLAELGAALGSALSSAVGKAMEPTVERELNIRAREQYDLYAVILPYRVRVVLPARAG